MAVRKNDITFRNAQFSIAEDNTIRVHEITRDGEFTHDFHQWIAEFMGEDRYVDLVIREKFDIQGEEE